MADTFNDVRDNRFDNTDRNIGSESGTLVRLCRVVGQGRAASDTATYWNVEPITDSHARTDINTNDRYGTGNPVYVVIRDVAAAVGASYQEGDVVSVKIRGGVSNPVGEVDESPGTHGHIFVNSNQAVILSGGGGGGGCMQGITNIGVLFD